mmetsp:Transcript_2340/g.5256  ORF Transcript_2340/g.5256 Transcript_2340/m.5256 type:complete len:262 (+) Transcript_2340:273-1058(+)|eukprot:CAMPEP_0202890090 /NCGR_PEP_ID=MMETSP1392-20130828/601_1 /ASSEMBLY_ACC=CAM_ASM_000868 /TAXON_ID=225041 /ORGANISM="Chlamydomonas chlamydogama, Strain SAG 11-48b" /LENGTH=261 /DNA_ID=CAMNT_0049573581 /DNA_START=273 /DNA_END=1058 /DNA_ORIENTATION=+
MSLRTTGRPTATGSLHPIFSAALWKGCGYPEPVILNISRNLFFPEQQSQAGPRCGQAQIQDVSFRTRKQEDSDFSGPSSSAWLLEESREAGKRRRIGSLDDEDAMVTSVLSRQMDEPSPVNTDFLEEVPRRQRTGSRSRRVNVSGLLIHVTDLEGSPAVTTCTAEPAQAAETCRTFAVASPALEDQHGKEPIKVPTCKSQQGPCSEDDESPTTAPLLSNSTTSSQGTFSDLPSPLHDGRCGESVKLLRPWSPSSPLSEDVF